MKFFPSSSRIGVDRAGAEIERGSNVRRRIANGELS
jgi:hypothetical protein